MGLNQKKEEDRHRDSAGPVHSFIHSHPNTTLDYGVAGPDSV